MTDRLIAVTCGIQDDLISIRAYVAGKCSEDDIERVHRIAAEDIADFPEGHTIEESCSPVGNEDPQMLDFWAFKRAASRRGGFP